MLSLIELEQVAAQIRRDALRMVYLARSGHPGGALGCADLFAALYFNILNHQPVPFDMDGKDQDLFFLSNGHVCAAWYSALARSGYFPVSELSTFRMLDSRLQGHPATCEGLPGIRVASGSLGQGLSVAIGSALAKKRNSDPHLVYCLLGDGELQEGQVWEAAMFAHARMIDNIIAIVDYNGQQIDGPVETVLSLGNLKNKWEAFGWTVLETAGNNMSMLLQHLNEAKCLAFKKKPVVVVMHTIMGKGVDFMENDHRWHGSPPNDEQFERAISQLPETLSDF
ncbi:MAG TPA: transketolase [Bacteroidales bacterium]|nr:transketolase [Bacteroidales bacterium]